MHNTAAEHHGLDLHYHAVALESGEFNLLASFFNNRYFRGANVTIPYKLMIRDYLDHLDDSAEAVQAVNTVVSREGQLWGYNTDSYGFAVPLEQYSYELEGGRAIIFGTGGATRAIIRALQTFNVTEIILISRNPSNKTKMGQETGVRLESYDSWTVFAEESALIVNATPLGMEPDVESCPVQENEQHFLSDSICYDIVYKPLQTKFLKLAHNAGARTISGLEMLIHQGNKSFELWTGQSFPLDKVRAKLHEAIEHLA